MIRRKRFYLTVLVLDLLQLLVGLIWLGFTNIDSDNKMELTDYSAWFLGSVVVAFVFVLLLREDDYE